MEENTKATLQERLQASLARANGRISQLSVLRTVLVSVMLATGALSALLAGLSGVTGSPAIGSGDAGWGLTCVLAAVLTLTGTLASGANEQFHISETLDRARSCAGRLNALQVTLSTGSLAISEVANKYADLVTEYQLVLG
jgi:hypothetical protein